MPARSRTAMDWRGGERGKGRAEEDEEERGMISMHDKSMRKHYLYAIIPQPQQTHHTTNKALILQDGLSPPPT